MTVYWREAEKHERAYTRTRKVEYKEERKRDLTTRDRGMAREEAWKLVGLRKCLGKKHIVTEKGDS